jgi:sterol desaturase/sphingolipid hydroxylase (fatty acid hydroxylase superfamily)
MLDFFHAFLSSLAEELMSPQKRIFIGYLLVAFVIALMFLTYRYRQKMTVMQRLHFLFSPSVWLSRSSQADIKLWIINRLFFGNLTLRFVTKTAVAAAVYVWLLEIFGFTQASLENTPAWLASFIFTFFLFVFDDYGRFWVHRLLHKIPVLWEFHKVHHSAEVLTPLTVFRTHPVEGLLFSLVSILIQGAVMGVAIGIFGSQVSLSTIIGANIFTFAFHLVGSNLRHSNIPIQYPRVAEYWFISPAQHQIHHSLAKRHYNKNFGVTFACWDRWHNSFHFSEKTRIHFGLRPGENSLEHGLFSLWLMPFRRAMSNKSAFTKTIKW